MSQTLESLVIKTADDCRELGIPNEIVKKLKSMTLDPFRLDNIADLDLITERYSYFFYQNCFSDIATLTSLASVEYHFLLRKVSIYNFVFTSSYRMRIFVNEINHVFIEENVFNYFINVLSQDIESIKSGNDSFIYACMPDKRDAYFNTYRRALDYFMSKHGVGVPKEIMTDYYKKDSKHYRKISHLLK